MHIGEKMYDRSKISLIYIYIYKIMMRYVKDLSKICMR